MRRHLLTASLVFTATEGAFIASVDLTGNLELSFTIAVTVGITLALIADWRTA